MKNVLFIFGLMLLLTGCADNVSFEQAATMQPVGFMHGAWHGAISFFAFIWSLFDDSATIYAIYNNGGWYNFGYLFGFGGAFRILVILPLQILLALFGVKFASSNSRRGRR